MPENMTTGWMLNDGPSKQASLLLAENKTEQIKHTAGVKCSGSICILWYDLRLFWLNIKCLKSVAKLLFLNYTNKYRSDLSKKIVFGPIGQKTTEM